MSHAIRRRYLPVIGAALILILLSGLQAPVAAQTPEDGVIRIVVEAEQPDQDPILSVPPGLVLPSADPGFVRDTTPPGLPPADDLGVTLTPFDIYELGRSTQVVHRCGKGYTLTKKEANLILRHAAASGAWTPEQLATFRQDPCKLIAHDQTIAAGLKQVRLPPQLPTYTGPNELEVPRWLQRAMYDCARTYAISAASTFTMMSAAQEIANRMQSASGSVSAGDLLTRLATLGPRLAISNMAGVVGCVGDIVRSVWPSGTQVFPD